MTSMKRIYLTGYALGTKARLGLSMLALLAMALVGTAFWSTAADAEEPAEPVWSADMTVVQYNSVSIGAASADLFSNIGGSGNLQIKSLWSYVPGRDLRLAFDDGVPNAADYTLQAGDLSLEFPEGSSGQNGFTFEDVDVDWEDGQTIHVRIVPTAEIDAPPANAPASGLPTVSGTAQVGQTLTADTSGIGDADGLTSVSYAYQWLADDTGIDGATGSSYTLTSEEVGKAITVRVAFTDDAENEESLTSTATAAVAARPNSPATGLPTISGTAHEGETLTADTSGISDSDGLIGVTYSYRWLADDTGIAGATGSSYTLTSEEVGKAITVRISFTDDAENEESLTSAATAAVTASVLTASFQDAPESHNGSDAFTFRIQFSEPVATGYRTLKDSALTVTGGTVTSASRVDGRRDLWQIVVTPDAGGALSVTLPVTTDCDDPGAVCTANGKKLSSGDRLLVPGRSTPENSPATGAPTIVGTPQVGETLAVDTSGIFDVNGLSGVTYSYQWLADDTGIDGATGSSYTLTAEEVGKAIKVRVNFTDDAGNGESLTSAGTPAVASKANIPASGVPAISGPAQVGYTLTADTSAIGDADGLSRFPYACQWIRSDGGADADIAGATHPTYTLTGDDEGKTIKLRVTLIDDKGNSETLTSAATAEVGESQDKPQFLVSNLGAGAGGADGIQRTLGAARSGFAQAFTTGAKTGGYVLGSVGIQVSNFYDVSAAADHLRVTINGATGEGGPGDAHCTLTNPSSFPAPGVSAFEAPTGAGSCPQLAMETTYFVVIEWLNPSETGSFAIIPQTYSTEHSAATGEDQGGAAGWSIADQSHYLTVSSNVRTWTTYDETASFKIKVKEPAPKANNPATGLPTISGTTQVGETLTADTSGISDADGLDNVEYSYQWLADDADISGATDSTYTLTDDDVGKAIKVKITFTDDADNKESLTSAAASGPLAGFTLLDASDQTALASLEDGDEVRLDDPSVGSYAIRVDVESGSAIGSVKLELTGAKSHSQTESISPYSLYGDNGASALHGQNLPVGSYTLRATAYSEGGGAGDELGVLEVFFTVAAANSPATGAPTISGTVQADQTLTAGTSRIADLDGLTNVSYSYQWLADDTDIDGATGSGYTLTDDEVGKAIKVKVTFTDDKDNEESLTSAATASVAARPNSPATGEPAISGTAQAGETLTASTNDIADADGLTNVSYSYQWLADDTDILGATGSTYNLTDDDVGKTIKVKVSFTDDRNNEESLTSAATAQVTALPNNPATGELTISGTIQSGETLTAQTSGITDSDGLTKVSYGSQWLADDTDIQGATSSTYDLTDDEVGKAIKVKVTFTDDADNEENLISAATASVAARPNNPATGEPTISGTAQAGETLTASTDDIADADGLDNVSYSHQWLADDADIPGATDSTYTLTDDEVGKAIKVKVSFTDDADNEESLTSAATAQVTALPNSPATGAPTISGMAQAGETLTAVTTGIADADGLDNVSYSHQWLADDADIPGATYSTYTLTDDEVGKAIKVKVSFTDDKDNEESLTSMATASVAARPNNPATGAPTISGGAQAGQTLTAQTSGITDSDGLTNVSYSHQWLADDAEIQNATDSTYTLTDDEVGKAIKVKVSFTDDRNNEESLTSDATAAVKAAPEESSTTTLAGFTLLDASDQTVLTTLSDGAEVSLPDPSGDSYAIRVDTGTGSTIGSVKIELTGAKNASSTDSAAPYSLFGDDADGLKGETLPAGTYTLRATASSEAAESGDVLETLEVSFTVNSPTTGAPAITGQLRVGRTLTANTSQIADKDGLTQAAFSYRWLRNDGTSDEVIEGAASSTYTLVSGDEGRALRVGVTFTDDGGTRESATSAVTSLVKAVDADAPWNGRIVYITFDDGPHPVYTPQILDVLESHGARAMFFVNGVNVERYPDIIARMIADGHGIGNHTWAHERLTDLTEEEFIDTVTRTQNAIGKYASPCLRPPYGAITGAGRRWAESLGLEVVMWDMPTHAWNGHGVDNFVSSMVSKIRDGSIVLMHDGAGHGNAVLALNGMLERGADTGYRFEPVCQANGLPTISGTARVGETLTANTSEVTDPDGLADAEFSYRWFAAGSEIRGATTSSYTLTLDEVGRTIRVRVSFTDDADNEESLFSDATSAVVGLPNNFARGLPTISGTAQAGETLTVNVSAIVDPDGLTDANFRYQWLAGNANIPGATGSSYTLTDDDVGKAIKVKVSFTDDADNEENLTSKATASVAAHPNNPATGELTISGTIQSGETLTAQTSGITDSDGLTKVSYGSQWLADDTDIQGATSSTYDLTDDEVGKAIKVKVTFTDDADNEENLISAATASVAARPNNPATGEPTISGTAQAGETLTASTDDIADADGLDNVSYSHQWLADDADISGATDSTYTLTDDDVGKAIKVKVSFTDDRNNDESLTSSATDTVAARPDSSDTDAPPGDPSTTVDVAVGDTVKGELEELHEVDWFRAHLLESESYRIDMRGAWGGEWALVDGEIVWISAGTLEDPKLLGVYSGANVLVPGTDEEVSGDDRGDYAEGKNSRIESFSPPSDGYYYIAAAAEEGGWTGTYELTVTVVTEE